MKQTINLYDFRRAFETTRPDNFSYEGLGILFEALEELSDDTLSATGNQTAQLNKNECLFIATKRKMSQGIC